LSLHKDDIAIVRQLLSGDQSAFAAFYDAYFPRVYRFCKNRLANDECAKDVVQQTLTKAMLNLQTYRGEASLYTWLCQIGRNEISAWYKKVGRKQAQTSSFDQDESLVSAIESIAAGFAGDLQEQSQLVQIALDSLPGNYGTVLELKYIDGFSVTEIAEQLKTGEIGVQSQLARARKAFRLVYNDLTKEYQTT
jgi:RNA polymerase sigma factor, sigma-70 family